jgi:hypothetical protein
LTIATQHYLNGSVSHKEGDYSIVQASVLDIQIRLPIFGPVQLAIFDKESDGVSLFFEQKSEPSHQNPHTTSGFRSVFFFAISPLFVDFFETVRPWLEQNAVDSAKWPSVLDFGRVIRNACSHGGKLHMPKPSSRPVSWYQLHYDPSQHGKQIIGADLGFADLLILMIEMSDELDRIGCSV